VTAHGVPVVGKFSRRGNGPFFILATLPLANLSISDHGEFVLIQPKFIAVDSSTRVFAFELDQPIIFASLLKLDHFSDFTSTQPMLRNNLHVIADCGFACSLHVTPPCSAITAKDVPKCILTKRIGFRRFSWIAGREKPLWRRFLPDKKYRTEASFKIELARRND
jgi:hypothetical protein